MNDGKIHIAGKLISDLTGGYIADADHILYNSESLKTKLDDITLYVIHESGKNVNNTGANTVEPGKIHLFPAVSPDPTKKNNKYDEYIVVNGKWEKVAETELTKVVGPVGPQGPRGERGPVGPQGPAGTNGTNGKDGINGIGISKIVGSVLENDPNKTTVTVTLTNDEVKQFFVPNGTNGKDGGPGPLGESNIVAMAFTSEKLGVKIELPTTGTWDKTTHSLRDLNNNWKPNTEGLTPPIWMTSANFDNNGKPVSKWTKAIKITGEKGDPGADGLTRQYIYILSNDNPGTPAGRGKDNFEAPGEWSNHPKGVDNINKYEWMSYSDKSLNLGEAPTWSEWQPPVIWSHYGVNGTDGDGVKYAYFRTKTGVNPYDSKNLPLGDGTEETPTDKLEDVTWTGEPQGVSIEWPYEWVSVIKSINGKWGSWSHPAIWAKYGADGLSGKNGQSSFRSTVFKRSATNPGQPTGGDYKSPIPTNQNDWRDGIPEYNSSKSAADNTLWMSTKIFTSDGLDPESEWTTPVKAEGTNDIDIAYSSAESDPGNPGTDHNRLNNNWTREASAAAIWMATSVFKNGTWTNWTVTRIKGERGPAGPAGIGISKIVGSALDSSKTTVTVTLTNDEVKQFFVPNGTNGKDATQTEYIYTRTNTPNSPQTINPDTTQRTTDKYVPNGWSSAPQGVDIMNKYEWQLYRKKNPGDHLWGPFLGKNGQPGNALLYAKFNVLDIDNNGVLSIDNGLGLKKTTWRIPRSTVETSGQFCENNSESGTCVNLELINMCNYGAPINSITYITTPISAAQTDTNPQTLNIQRGWLDLLSVGEEVKFILHTSGISSSNNVCILGIRSLELGMGSPTDEPFGAVEVVGPDKLIFISPNGKDLSIILSIIKIDKTHAFVYFITNPIVDKFKEYKVN